MTIYAVNKLCYMTLRDPALRAQLKSDPLPAMEAFLLSGEEKELLVRGQVGELFRRGAHPDLLSHLSRFELFGLTVKNYSESMRAASSGPQ